jgi:hypothetical protein
MLVSTLPPRCTNHPRIAKIIRILFEKIALGRQPWLRRKTHDVHVEAAATSCTGSRKLQTGAIGALGV